MSPIARPHPAAPRRAAPAAAAALLALLAACTPTADIDARPFACTANRDCGVGAFCVAGTCRLFGADLPDATDADADTAPDALSVPACQASLVASETADRARFFVTEDAATGRRRLTITFDGLEATYDLPEDVVALEPNGDDTKACCEDPCCAALGAPE